MLRPMVRLATVLGVTTALIATAHAEPLPPCDERAEAEQAYRAGADALREARYNDAARKFAEADERCPHEIALDEAMRAVLRADNPILCMELAQRAERRGVLPERRAELDDSCGDRVGRILVVCPGATCRASVDGVPVRLHEEVTALVGRRIVDLSVDGGPMVPHPVDVRPGTVARVPTSPSPAAPAVSPDPASPAPTGTTTGDASSTTSSGLHPAIFFVGLGLTAVAGGVLTWSAVDTLDRNDAFKSDPNPTTRGAGTEAQLRTNALIGVTAALGVATAITAIFTDWGGENDGVTATMTVDPRGRGAFATWRAAF